MSAQRRIRQGELLKGEARHLGDHVVDARLETCRRDFRDVVLNLVQRVANRQLGGEFGNRETGCLRGQGRRPRDARVHLDDNQLAIFRVQRELNVRTTSFDTDFAHDREAGVAHVLILAVGQSLGWRNRDRITGMHAHRIEILDRANDDAVVLAVTHDLHLEFLPAEQTLLDQDLVDGGKANATRGNRFEFFLVVGDAATAAAHREGGANHARQANPRDRGQSLIHAARDFRLRALQANRIHGLAELLAIFGFANHRSLGSDHFDTVFLEDALVVQRQSGVQRRLPA